MANDNRVAGPKGLLEARFWPSGESDAGATHDPVAEVHSGTIAGRNPVKHFAAVLLACATLSACGSGGEGEDCKSGGPLGPVYCDEGLICNGAAGYTCERAMSRHENAPCDVNDLCATGLWCNHLQQKCQPWLGEGNPCTNPFSCGPSLACVKGAATRAPVCGQGPPDGGLTQATVIGTLTLPGTAQANGTVAIYTTAPPGGTPVASSGIASAGGRTSIDYQIPGAPAGTYFIFGFLDVDGSLGTSPTPGDYAGWYGHNGDGNPPAAANAVLPESGTVRIDFSLVLR
jgi:predicted small secreted protein